MMTLKCVHKGCEKAFENSDETCIYHSGKPVFHEGQKGWTCCKPRVLTFDEFLSIPPCTTGTHSTVDDTPSDRTKPSGRAEDEGKVAKSSPLSIDNVQSHQKPKVPTPQVAQPAPADLAQAESDSDDPAQAVPPNTACKRRGCRAFSTESTCQTRDGEECVYHPGQAIFHEGSKGYVCCKRRVLEFQEFLELQGCSKKPKHLFLGKQKPLKTKEEFSDLRHDFYQTPSTVIASVFLKKIDKSRSRIEFVSSVIVSLDLRTQDDKHYQTNLPLFGPVDPAESSYKILGTKLELSLTKADGRSWATLRSDEPRPNEIIQVGGPAKS